MLSANTVAAILAFCSLASAAPAKRQDGWAHTGSAASITVPAYPTATGGWEHQDEPPVTSSYYSSLSYAHSDEWHTEVAGPIATSDPVPSPGSNSGASNDANSGAGSPVNSTPASPPSPPAPTGLSGLSKVQQILLSDTRADAVNNVLKDDSDFVFDFNKARKFGPGKGGEIVQANRKAFPALTGTGIGMAVGFLGPCGFNTPHVHNRATELLIVTKGKVVSEMVIENGVENADKKPRDVMNTIEELQATPYFMGALHTQFNPTCEDVTFIAPLSSEDFGANTMAQAYFALEDDTIRAAAGNHIDGADVDAFRGIISTNVALGVEQCLKTCGIAKRK
ncbi:RmlC-like cupin domain-containing protein [Hypomontagnella submonticulosa]|nr:RmlC-like cupin domain-containing protein [Hypomontagnella submonticulosa]